MSSESAKLSLSAAILININIMLGSGIFANTVLLAQLPGALGFAIYLLVGIMLFPLIFSLAALIKKYPTGGFYTYAAQELHPFVGFISTWAYFIGKLASAALSIHVFCSLMYHLFPVLNVVPLLVSDMVILTLFTMLNLYNMRTGSAIQGIFLVLKSIPLLFGIIISLYYFKGAHLMTNHWILSGIPLGIPYVLFAFGGFETSCSISRAIKDPEKNGPRALIISFAAVIIIVCLFQLALYASLGHTLANSNHFKETFPHLLDFIVTKDHTLYSLLLVILHVAIGVSALGASYGILYGNMWNLYTLAEHGHTFGKSVLTTLNKQRMPLFCVLIEALFCTAYLLTTHGNQKTLQPLSALGSAIAYSASACALLAAVLKRHINVSRILPVLGIASCIPLCIACVRSFFIFNITPLLWFSILLLVGSIMYGITQKRISAIQH